MAMLEPLPNGVSQIIVRDGIRSLRNQHANPKPPDDAHSAPTGPRGKRALIYFFFSLIARPRTVVVIFV